MSFWQVVRKYRFFRKHTFVLNGINYVVVQPIRVLKQRYKTIQPIYVKVETHLFRIHDSDTPTQAAMQNYPICIVK